MCVFLILSHKHTLVLSLYLAFSSFLFLGPIYVGLRERMNMCDHVSVCVCVCVCERARARARLYTYVCVCVCMRLCS